MTPTPSGVLTAVPRLVFGAVVVQLIVNTFLCYKCLVHTFADEFWLAFFHMAHFGGVKELSEEQPRSMISFEGEKYV